MNEPILKLILERWMEEKNFKYRSEYVIHKYREEKNFRSFRIDYAIFKKVYDYDINFLIECKGSNQIDANTLRQLEIYRNVMNNKPIFLAIPKDKAKNWKAIMIFFNKEFGIISIDIDSINILYDPFRIFCNLNTEEIQEDNIIIYDCCFNCKEKIRYEDYIISYGDAIEHEEDETVICGYICPKCHVKKYYRIERILQF